LAVSLNDGEKNPSGVEVEVELAKSVKIDRITLVLFHQSSGTAPFCDREEQWGQNLVRAVFNGLLMLIFVLIFWLTN